MLIKLLHTKACQTQLTTIKITIYIAESQLSHDWPTQSGHIQQKKDPRNPITVLKINPPYWSQEPGQPIEQTTFI